MRPGILGVLLLWCLSVHAQVPDSVEIARLSSQVVRLSAALDSVALAQRDHQSHEDFFTDTLAGQTTIFSVIVTIAVALVGLFSFRALRRDFEDNLNDIRGLYSKYESRADSMEKSIKESRNHIYNTAAKVNMFIAQTTFGDGMYSTSAGYSLAAAYYVVESDAKDDLDNNDVNVHKVRRSFASALKSSLKSMNMIDQNYIDNHIESCDGYVNTMRQRLNKIDSKNHMQKELTARIRLQIARMEEGVAKARASATGVPKVPALASSSEAGSSEEDGLPDSA